MTLVIGLAIRSSVVLAAGLLLSAWLAKRSAALRHRVLAASLLGAALVMPFSLALPEWTVTLPARAIDASPEPSPVLHVEAQAPTPTATAPAPPVRDAISPIVLVWLAGVLVAGGILVAGLVRVSRLAARASRVEDQRWLRMLDTVASRYGLTRAIALVRTESSDVLATWGILRPQVLLPRHADGWTLDRAHVVLCHELAHIRRRDWLVQMAAESLRAVLWFNPLAWVVCTRLRRESEQACDDEVLGLGVGGRDYAAHLLELARQCRRSGSTWAPALPMAHPSTLERRIAAMLNPRLDRHAPSRRAVATLGLGLLLVTMPAASLRARLGQAPLSGTIYDVTGGVLPGVEVTLVDADQLTSVVTTNASGRFEFPSVEAGTYVLEAAIPGFRKLRQQLELREARDWDRAVTLQVGEVSETVMVRETRVTAPPTGYSGQKQAPGVARPVRVGGNVRAPRKEAHVRPVYPPAMREAGLTGVVPLEAIIGRDGTVSAVRVLSAQVHPDFAIAAVDAVRQWRFTPTLLNGAPVEVVMTVSVRFNLDE